MNYLVESIFVGIYTCWIYLLVNPFFKNFYALLLVCGFCKHFFGFSLGLWTWYCNNGDACIKVLSNDKHYHSRALHLLRDSIYEALAFLVTGTMLHFIIPKGIYMFLVIGVALHIGGEILGIHTNFCVNSCV